MNSSLDARLQSLPKFAIYLILIVITTIPLFVTMVVPNKPDPASIDLYTKLMTLPTDRPVLIASDWTGSTRGESKGAFNAVIKILMRRGIKFALYSTGDPQAPRVYQDAIAQINAQRVSRGEAPYERWNQWVNVGFFPGSEAATNGIATDIRATFSGRKDTAPGQGQRDVINSPVFSGITKVSDFSLLLVITASKTSNFTIERIKRGQPPLAMAVTGVMVPETNNFYQSGQIIGFAGGLKGVYDMEGLMTTGVTDANPPVPGFPDMKADNVGQGTAYYPTLHFAMFLLIVMVVIGNVGMFLSRKGAR
ncbi:hypothetical protein EON79_03800 [bacterium]|nr:MAG: hypothetical protein EON79_03800 [bacterium]